MLTPPGEPHPQRLPCFQRLPPHPAPLLPAPRAFHHRENHPKQTIRTSLKPSKFLVNPVGSDMVDQYQTISTGFQRVANQSTLLASRRMKAHNIIHYPLIAVLGLWFLSAIALHPRRPWSWWVCLAPLAIAFIAGLGCIGSLIHMALFPDASIWTSANQPGAIAVIGTFLYLVPSTALLWHLIFIRRQFHATANA